MPWYGKQMKDVTTCDKPRIGGNNLRPVDFRIGQPVPSNVGTSTTESIGCVKTTQGTETSKYLEEEKTIVISLVVASEKEIA
jgi:hypothetical protein